MKKKFYKILTLSALLAVMLTTSDPAMASTVTSGDGEKDLQGLIDSMPYGIDDYAYGKNPGMVGDSVIYAEFFNVYTDALAIAGSGTSTDEEKSAAYDKLKAALTKIEAAIVPITDGTYYITTANSMFTDTMAWFAPYASNVAGWTKFKPNALFMWNIKKMEDGNYSIQNVALGRYLNHCQNIDQAGSPLDMTADLETEQVITTVAPNGQFSFRGATSVWSYNTEGHLGGAGTAGPLASWYNTAANSEGAWRLCRVSDAELAAAQAAIGRDLLPQWLSTFADNYAEGTDPGYYSIEAHAAYLAKVNEARTFVAGEHTDAEYMNMYNQVIAAQAHLDSSIVKITDGYYAFASAPYEAVNTGSAAYAWKLDKDANWLRVSLWDTEDPRFIWKVTNMGDGKYSVQNYVTGQYINSSDLMAAGAHIDITPELTTQQIISQVSGKPCFTMTNQSALNSGLYYNNDTENKGVHLVSPGMSIYIHHFSDDEAEMILANYATKLTKDSLTTLCANVEDLISATYSIDTDSPVVSDTSQLFCNNKETTEGKYEYLIDGITDDNNTNFMHSAWSGTTATLVNEYHYLRVYDADGLPDPLSFRFNTRYQSNVMFCPKKMVISVSNDTITWKQLTTLDNTTAVSGNVQYTSPAIFGTGGYKYFKIDVITTPTNQLDAYGHPFFVMTEFNTYKMKQAISDEEAEAINNLSQKLSEARAHLDDYTFSSADIANLQSALTAYLLVRKDTAHLEQMLTAAAKYVETAEGGEDLFTFPQENIDKMLEVLDQTTSERPFANIKQARVAELDTLVTRTYNELRESMHGPDPDTWYSVLSADQKSLDRYGNSIYGQHAWMGGLTSVDGLGAGDDTVYINIQNDPRSAWQFKPTDEPGKYYMVNCGSGWPENNGPVLLSALGEGQFSITTGQNFDMIYNMFTASLPGVPFTNQAYLTPEKNGPCAWTMEPASESLTYTMKLRAGSYRAMVLPYATKAMPLGTKGETVTTYNVCGYEASEDGKQISGIKLKEFTGETIPAGTPFVIKIDGDYSAKEYVVVDFSPEINSAVSRETSPVNGLTGTFSRIEFAEPVIVFSKDSAIVRKTGSTLSPQQAYLDMSKIVNDNTVTPDIIVPVSGFMENTVGIQNASVSKDKALVNVYTSDGVLIRKDVKRSDALKGLAKGVYIVGSEKKAVK